MAAAATTMDRKNSLGWSSAPADPDFDTLMQRRSSSIGFSMLDGDLKRRGSSLGLGQSVGLEDVVMPPHRPLVGGASAAAYEAARADHYRSLAAKKRLSGDTPGPKSSFGAAGMMSVSAFAGGGPGLSASSNQHYEMLKLHHMNLLNEIQETTLMMNLYQQQQLQQQRQQLQEQENSFDAQGTKGMSMLQQGPGGLDLGSMYGGGMSGVFASRARGLGGMEGMGRSPSLGLGGSVGQSGSEQLQALLKQQGDRCPPLGLVSNINDARPELEMTDKGQEFLAQEQEQRILEERLQKIRAEIAQRQREAEELEAQQSGMAKKRKSGSEK